MIIFLIIYYYFYFIHVNVYFIYLIKSQMLCNHAFIILQLDVLIWNSWTEVRVSLLYYLYDPFKRHASRWRPFKSHSYVNLIWKSGFTITWGSVFKYKMFSWELNRFFWMGCVTNRNSCKNIPFLLFLKKKREKGNEFDKFSFQLASDAKRKHPLAQSLILMGFFLMFDCDYCKRLLSFISCLNLSFLEKNKQINIICDAVIF